MDNSLTKYNFWDLINKYTIEIPIIQRDYAQGRKLEKITEIRNSFLDNIYESIVENTSLDLDFIYGSLTEDKVFIPLDGQQRLTTLFLLHWYFAIKEDRLKDEWKILSKFTYKTRSSSREFCNELVNDINLFNKVNFEDIHNISEEIRNAYWFFISWEKDPTISSMLVMLDAIHCKFKSYNNIFDKLIDSDKKLITFQFIELENFGLEDSLYIKMNARGKPLTHFENFKAKFQQLLENLEKEKGIEEGLAKEFSIKIDGDWTDLFWYYRDREKNIFDNQIMNFFRALIINNYASIKGRKAFYKELNYLINNKSHISFAKYMELECFNKELIEEIVCTLDTLKNNSNEIKTYMLNDKVLNEKELFEAMINNSVEENLTYYQRVQIYAITKYFIKNKFNIDPFKFSEWIRVVRNLSINTTDNSVAEFSRSIQSIAELVEHSDNILGFLTDDKNDIKRFLGEQVEEERIKARLLLKDKKWRDIITSAENHGYFEGQIGFLLDYSNILDSYNKDKNLDWSIEEDNKFYKKFTNYLNKATFIFDDNGLSVDNDLWRRALLCKGDYLLKSGRNHSFLIDRDRDVSWKRLLRNNKKRNLVKSLLDSINIKDIENSLQNIIDNNEVNDWRRYFVKIPSILSMCRNKRSIRKLGDNNILLLNSSTTAGYNWEYYTYALYLQLKSMGNIDIRYHKDRGVDSLKFIYFDNNNLEIYYLKDNNIWAYEIYEDDEVIKIKTQIEVIDYLKKEGHIL